MFKFVYLLYQVHNYNSPCAKFQHACTHSGYASHLEKLAANLELLLTSQAVFGLCTVPAVVPDPLILGCAFAGRLNRFFALGWAVIILGCWAGPARLCLPGLLAGWFPSPNLRLDGLSEFLCALSVVFGRFAASCFPVLGFLKEWQILSKLDSFHSKDF